METFWWGKEYISLGIRRVWFSVGLHCLRGAFMAIVHLGFCLVCPGVALGCPSLHYLASPYVS